MGATPPAGPDLLMWLTFAVIVAMVLAYALELAAVEVIAVATVVAWLAVFWLVPALLGTEAPLSPEEILAGFSNPALLTVLALLVVAQGLFHTDALQRLSDRLASVGRGSSMRPIVILLLGATLISAVVNDTPVVVMFLPIVTAVAAARGVATSKVLMPLSFAALLGGTTTLIGTSTNLLVAGVARDSAGIQIDFFTFTVPAILIVLPGLLYVAFLLPRIIAARGGMADRLTGGTGKQFIAQIDVGYGHPLVGEQAVAGLFPPLKDLTVRLVQRGPHAYLPPFEDLRLQPGDSLIVAATRSVLTKALSDGSAQSSETETSQPLMPTRDVSLAEVVVAPGSRLIGRTIEQAGIHHDTDTVVLGIERRSRMPRSGLNDIRLDAGDVLLVGGTSEAIAGLRTNRDILLMEWSTSDLPQRRLANRALAIFAVMVVYAAAGLGPIVLGALTAALAMVVSGCLNIRQAARAFDRRIFLMIGSSLAAAAALEATGGAAFLAQQAVATFAGGSQIMTLSVLFLVISLLTNVISNNAAAVLLTPIAIGIALETGADPMPFVLAVMMAASCAFATPIGYQTNMLVMAPGHYRFRDFLIGGGPLVIIIWVAFSLVVPWYYGLG